MRISDLSSDVCASDLVPAKRDPDEPLDWYEVELELLGIRDKYSLERMQTEAVDWQGALVSLADDITTRLSEALSWLSTFGKVTEARDLTIYDYRSISPHPQRSDEHTSELQSLMR